MTIFETIGMAWVIFTSSLASIEIIYLAFIGLKNFENKRDRTETVNVPLEVKEMFKVRGSYSER